MLGAAPVPVHFDSDDVRLTGRFHNADATSAPAILVTGSWTTVKEQMADLYAPGWRTGGFGS